jgi:nucleoside-triphosphatase
MNRLVITGRPGVGKTTVFLKVLNSLKGFKVYGFYCPEVRVSGKRVGFDLVYLDGGEEWMARVDCEGVKVGKYCLNLGAGERLSLKEAISSDLIAVDEVGPMEMRIPKVAEFISRILSLDRPCLLVAHRSMMIRGEIFTVTEDNRDHVSSLISSKLTELLRKDRP